MLIPRTARLIGSIRAALAGAFVLTFTTAGGAAEIDRGTFPPFVRSLNTTPHGYTVVKDPTGSAPTALVERFEVRPGDCGSEVGGFNDCAEDRERSELSEKGAREPLGTAAWYGWSFFVPADMPNVFPTKLDLGQFHQQGSHPVWMFQAMDGGLSIDNHVVPGTRMVKVIADDALAGRWHRIEVFARWSRGADGQFQLWVDDALKHDWHGPTATADLIYFKYGVYRSFLSRYKAARKVEAVPAQTVYFANVRRAGTRAGLAPVR